METVGLVGFGISVVALASLFSTCVECFDYFRLGQTFDKDFEILLVQLDLEKFRLLDWGNSIGVLRIVGDGGQLSRLETARKDIIGACLRQIASLLTNSEELQSKYGLRATTGSEAKGGRLKALPSTNSMNIFKTSFTRFCVRFASKPDSVGLLSKTKWAVRDKAKFEGLIHCLKDFIDGLYQVLPVLRETQDQTFGDDIASIIDISKLRLIQTACEESYRTWSSKASEIIRESESGTIDRRNIEERIQDAEFIREVGITFRDSVNLANSIDYSVKDALKNLPYRAELFFVFTEQCATVEPGILCDPYDLGRMCFGSIDFKFTASHRKKWNLGERITSRIDLSFLREHHRGIVYIYCAPYTRQIHTSMSICHGYGYSFALRVDDRILCSCCPESLGPAGLTSLRNNLKERDSSHSTGGDEYLDQPCFDQPWIEQRIFAIEEEMSELQSKSYAMSYIERIILECKSKSRDECVGIVVIGEVRHCSSILDALPFPVQARKPRETDIFQIERDGSTSSKGYEWERQYIGSYTPRKYTDPRLAVASAPMQPNGLRPVHLSTPASMLPPRAASRSLDSLKLQFETS